MLFVVGCASVWNRAPSEAMVIATAQPSGLSEAIRVSLAAESWSSNRAWTADSEWENRNHGFPSPRFLRWRFGKDWETSFQKRDRGESAMSGSLDSSARKSEGSESSGKSDPATKNDAKSAKEQAATNGTKNDAKPTGSSLADSAAEWDGFWPLTVSDLIQRRDPSGARGSVGMASAVDEGLRCLKQLAHSDNVVGWNAAILLAQHDPSSAVEFVKVLERLVTNPPSYVAETGELPLARDENAKGHTQTPVAPNKSGIDNSKAASREDDRAPAADATKKLDIHPRPAAVPKTVSVPTRSAAAEAWCLVLAASGPDPVDGLAPAGRALERPDLPVGVRAELFLGVARWVSPANIPRLENAFREGDASQRAPVEIRRAGIEACLVHALWKSTAKQPTGETRGTERVLIAESNWPATWISCRIDPDPQVRRTFIRWLGVARPNQAFELLEKQLGATDPNLRRATTESLAALHTEQARALLKKQIVRSHDQSRAIAVHALAAWGTNEVVSFVHDSSPAVRGAAATELGKGPTVETAILISELVVDRNIEVQLAAVDAVKNWPNDLAFPLLLQSMRDGSAKARQQAALQLLSRRKVTTPYQFDGPPAQRAAVVNVIATEIGSSLSYLDHVLTRKPQAKAQVDEIRAVEIRAHLTALIENPADSPAGTEAVAWLRGISARDVPLVETFLLGPTKAPTDRIYREVLPKVSPAYASLVDLENNDVNVRRRGAARLADLGQKATLTRPVLGRLRERLSHEPDNLVWRSAIAAVSSDSTDECADIANLALHHGLSDVRQLGCEYLDRHGQPAYAPWLLDLLEDPDRTVKLTAIRALGDCGNNIAVRGLPPVDGKKASPNLRDMMASSDHALRLAAAISLCRLGAAEGMQELVRLSYHPNAKIRAQVVKEMGLSGQTRFVSHLVSLAWTERNDRVREAVLESLNNLVPPEIRPEGLGDTLAVDAKIKQWAQWWQKRNGMPVQELPVDAPLASRPQKES